MRNVTFPGPNPSPERGTKDDDEWRGHALVFRGRRQAMLASNIANIDTPNYKARDISFADLLQVKASEAEPRPGEGGGTPREASLRRDVPIAPSSTLAFAEYRQPAQDNLDGNTVDSDVEHGEFVRNALLYRLALLSLEDETQEFKQAASLTGEPGAA